MVKIFMDTEFTGLHRNTTLISIGLISECGKTFYAEFTDYDKTQLNDWITQNVISKLKLTHHIKPSNSSWEKWNGMSFSDCDNALSVAIKMRDAKEIPHVEMIGPKAAVKDRLERWLMQWNATGVEIWSDCLAYDWMLFCDIFGTAFDIPESVMYIPFDLATVFKMKGIDPDVNREEFVFDGSIVATENKHNALWDAKVIKQCYEKLLTLNIK